MALSNKTTICIASIPAAVLSKSSLKLIMLTADESIVQMADKLVQKNPPLVDRCVVWVKDVDRNALIKQIPDISGQLDNCIAFSLSTKNKIGLIINSTDEFDYVILGSAFAEAGKSVLN